jgi:hypothetical protein
VQLPAGRRSKLRAVLAKQPVAMTAKLQVRAAPSRTGRSANLAIRTCTVTLQVRDKRKNHRTPMSINVVHAREQGTTPPGEKPIEWTLLTNRTILTTQDLLDVVFGYSMRWRIEELHRTWKSGACRVEQTQLRSTGAVIKWATILVAVAARIERIKQLARKEPDRPATDEFSPVEIRAVALLRFGKSASTRVPAGSVPSIHDVTLWIAEIGGYTGKSSGGPPGSVTLARGLHDVRTTVRALEALGQ